MYYDENGNSFAVLEINFLVLATWYKNVVAKLTYPVANISGHVIAQLPYFDNAFDHMELCFVPPAEE